jgi:predicted HTH domain antitoxin
MGVKAIQVIVEVPEEVSDTMKAPVQAKAHEGVVLELWEAGELSARRAAEELGLTYRAFLDLLAARGIPVELGELNLPAIEDAQRQLKEGRA